MTVVERLHMPSLGGAARPGQRGPSMAACPARRQGPCRAVSLASRRLRHHAGPGRGERTGAQVDRLDAALKAHARTVAVTVCVVVGLYLIARGVAGLVS